MPRVSYTKPALSFQDQLQQLKNRGLVIEDDQKAIFLLENISYYRLSAYWYPQLQEPKSSHIFKPGASFTLSFQLYCFDKELRKLVSSELEKIEVAIRAKMIYILSHQNGPFWINDHNLFSDQTKHFKTINKLKDEYEGSREDFILAFKANYSDPLPPSWMILEISSFGTLSSLYQNLRACLNFVRKNYSASFVPQILYLYATSLQKNRNLKFFNDKRSIKNKSNKV